MDQSKLDQRVEELLAQMTLEEKAGMCSGADMWQTKAIERLGIPSIRVADGPHGLRRQPENPEGFGMGASMPAVCFPSACASACAFDEDLMTEMGKTLGEEAKAQGVQILLGPAVNMKRSPLCGRNFEYISEDPHLAGSLAAAYIRGVQSTGAGTSMKHFAANNQETDRMSCSSDMTERTLREIYLTAFEKAVKEAEPATLMCSYNKINGTYASEDRELLTEILRDEWGFKGAVMSDWGAVNDRAAGIHAGLDLEMPSSQGYGDAQIVKAVKNGSLSEEDLDTCVRRMLRLVLKYHESAAQTGTIDYEADHQKAVQAAEKSGVLLKNDHGALPLQAGQKIVYIGEFAKMPRYQGGGSSHVNAHHVTNALDVALEKGRDVTYVKGFPADADESDQREFENAVVAARHADAAVIFAGLPESWESEGYDRESMRLPSCQNRLISAVCAAQPNTVVVLHNGSAVEMPWAQDPGAILEMYLAGEGVGEAEDAILYGEVNPSGKLAETFPMKLQDNPSYLNFPGDGQDVRYGEGVFIGYRYYDKKKMPVRFPFGYGLSYTTFRYSNLQLSSPEMNDDTAATVSVDITNSGDRRGTEIVQLYISPAKSVCERPERELKGFAAVDLAPGETRTVRFTVTPRDLSYYSEDLKDWYAPSGTYTVHAASSSADMRLDTELAFTTRRMLPFHLSGATLLGALLRDPRTKDATVRILGPFMEAAKANCGADDVIPIDVLLGGLPLKSVASFFGPQAVQAVAALMAELEKNPELAK